MGGHSGEFDRIDRFFKPLAAGCEGALGLLDDAGILTLAANQSLVITTDAMVEGVHYLPGEQPDRLARKLLRVNLSDLAAMGAVPKAYTLTTALPRTVDDDWLAAFVRGLDADQRAFGIHLLGGDSVGIPGPTVLSLTAFGLAEDGRILRRAGAGVGDIVFVSGTVGDGALGLAVARDGLPGLAAGYADALAMRYHLPEPRLALGHGLLGLATAAADISDGLIADLGHICTASAVAATIEADRIPLSEAARALIALEPGRRLAALAGGDDYELVFTTPPDAEAAVARVASAAAVRVTPVGRIEEARKDVPPVRLREADGTVLADVGGWQHF